MFGRLALLFVLVPLLELVVLVQLGRWVGLWPTIVLVLVTGVAGAALARAEGLRTFRAFQREAGSGQLPGIPVLDGLLILVGAAFLLTPGLLTDVAGLSLLLPFSRRWIRDRVRAALERRLRDGTLRVEVLGGSGGLGGFGPFGAGGGGGRPPGAEAGRGDAAGTGDERLDPRHEIRIDDVG